jgi:acylaminoacyl-peptidase
LNTAYNLTIACLTSLGFACLLVNYSGSTGFGDDSIYSLVGHIGSLDIDDTHCAAIWASNQPNIDSKNVFLNGGSHGGYISAYLVAREPDFYRGGVLRNPVINIGEMIGNSDIPDWYISL